MHLGLRLDGASWTVFETSKRPTAPIATPPLLNAELNSIPCAASCAVKPIHGAPPVIVADSESSPDAVLQPVDGQTFSTLSRSHWHAAYHAATQGHGYCRRGTQRQSLTKQLAEATLFTAQRTSAVARAFALFRLPCMPTPIPRGVACGDERWAGTDRGSLKK